MEVDGIEEPGEGASDDVIVSSALGRVEGENELGEESCMEGICDETLESSVVGTVEGSG